MNGQRVLASDTKGTFKEKMETSFFTSIVAKNMVVIFWQLILPSQEIASVESVYEQQKEEEFMLTKVVGRLELREER